MLRILAVDDERDICYLIKRSLENSGRFRVDVAHDGQAALDKLTECPYDLMLLDLVMPGVDGMEVLSKRDMYPGCRVIVLTAHSSVASAVHALRHNADDYLTKPVSPQELMDAIDKHIGVLRFAGIEIHTDSGAVLVNGQEIAITERLLALLSVFLSSPQETYDYEALLWAVDRQKADRQAATDTLSAQMSRLRTLLREYTGHEMIEIRKGVGFTWTHYAWQLERSNK